MQLLRTTSTTVIAEKQMEMDLSIQANMTYAVQMLIQMQVEMKVLLSSAKMLVNPLRLLTFLKKKSMRRYQKPVSIDHSIEWSTNYQMAKP